MSNRDLPMMPWYPDQFQASTVAWTWLERALYRCLLDAQWQLGKLPVEPKRLAIIVGMPQADFDEAWETVRDKFVPKNGGLVNQRLEFHQLRAMARKEHLSTAGRAGGRAYAQSSAKRRPTVAQASVQATVDPPSPSPVLEEPHTPQSGVSLPKGRQRGLRANGSNPRSLGTNPRAEGTNPRAEGTNPRSVAQAEQNAARWGPLVTRARLAGFRAPTPVETPEIYETALRLHERGQSAGDKLGSPRSFR